MTDNHKYVLVTSLGETTNRLRERFPDAIEAGILVIVAAEKLSANNALEKIKNREAEGWKLHAVVTCPFVGEPLIKTLDEKGIKPKYVVTPSLPKDAYEPVAGTLLQNADSVSPVSDELVERVSKWLKECGYTHPLRGRGSASVIIENPGLWR